MCHLFVKLIARLSCGPSRLTKKAAVHRNVSRQNFRRRHDFHTFM